MLASNRISAFDVILPTDPYEKGQVLNQVAAYMLSMQQRYLPELACRYTCPKCGYG